MSPGEEEIINFEYPEGAITDLHTLRVGKLYYVTRDSEWKNRFIDPIIFHHLDGRLVYHSDYDEPNVIRHYNLHNVLVSIPLASTLLEYKSFGFIFSNYWLAYRHYTLFLR